MNVKALFGILFGLIKNGDLKFSFSAVGECLV